MHLITKTKANKSEGLSLPKKRFAKQSDISHQRASKAHSVLKVAITSSTLFSPGSNINFITRINDVKLQMWYTCPMPRSAMAPRCLSQA